MGSSITRKEAIRRFKDRKPLRGVFAVRCLATGRAWVGSFTNLEAFRNSLWFSLRNGGHPSQTLQEEWNAHGEQTFQYEIVEKFDDDLCPIRLRDLLKDRKQHWVAQLGARAL
jgi:hypothetical protein